MPGLSGLDLLTTIREAAPDIDVVVMTAYEDMSTAVAAMKAGAFEYLVKPLDLNQIDSPCSAASAIAWLGGVPSDRRRSLRSRPGNSPFQNWLGKTRA